jgi:hypothetical protein
MSNDKCEFIITVLLTIQILWDIPLYRIIWKLQGRNIPEDRILNK